MSFNPIFLAFTPDSQRQRAMTIQWCSNYMKSGYIQFPKMFNVLGGKLKSLRMAQLLNNCDMKENDRYAAILEKTICKHYNLVSGILYLCRKSKRTLAIGGHSKDSGFMVLVGSKCSAVESPSLRQVHKKARSELMLSGTLYGNGISIWLTQPIKLPSATAAANFVTGSPTSGPTYWKNWHNKKLFNL